MNGLRSSGRTRFGQLAVLSVALVYSQVSASPAEAARRKKAPGSARAARQAKGAVAAKSAAAAKRAGPAPDIQKKEIKKEGSLEPKQDYGNPVGSKAATEFKQVKTETASAVAPTLHAEDFRGKLELQVNTKREEQIDYLQRILSIGTDESEKPGIYFRLGELFWEKSQWFFFKSQETDSKDEKKQFESESKRFQENAINLYQKIVTEYKRYDRTDEVLYYLGKSLIDVERQEEATTHFKRLIQEYPNSQFVPDAWLAVGEYFFNKAELAKALLAYKKAEAYKDSPVYGFAVYKQGWCYINTGDWDSAIERFRTVIFYADAQAAATKSGKLSLRKEAQKDYVRAYAHVGNAKEAKANFLKVGGKDNYRAMLETLGSIYIDQGKQKEVIAVFKDLIADQPNSTRIVVFQGRVVESAAKLGNKRYTVNESRTLTNFFVKVKKQSAAITEPKAKEDSERDLRQATEIAESQVRKLATSYHQEARKTKNDELYGYAMELYSNYLTIFPETLYAYDMRFFFAELLYKLGRYEDAAEQYTQVVLARPDPNSKEEDKKPRFLLQASEEAVRAYDQVVQDLDKKSPPKIVGLEAQPIPTIKLKLIQACERYLKYEPNGPKVVEIRYKMARIYYTYNHFEEAAPAFSEIVRSHPKHETAVYAANLTLDIYNGLKDYDTLNKLAREFYEIPELGDAEFKKGVRKIIENTTFKMIEAKEKSKDYLGSAEEYMRFVREFKESDLVDKSVYNAAVNYDKGGKLDKAIETRRYLIANFPKSPLVPDTLYNIAESYERVADFAQAATELENFAQKYGQDKRTPDALNNAGVYRRTLRQFPKAEEDFNTFMKLGAGNTLAPKVAFSLCEMDEEHNATSRAADCYFDYFRHYGSKDDEQRLLSQFRRGLIFRDKTHYRKGEEEALGYFRKEFGRMSAKGVKMPLANDAMASLAFAEAEQNFNEFKKMNLKINVKNLADTKVFAKSFKDKGDKSLQARKQFEQVVVTYKVAEYALASLFYIGEIYRDIVRALIETPVPNGLTNDQKQLYKEALKEKTLPIEDQAVEAYRNCVKRANELGIYNRWSVKALDRLHEYRPDEFPLVSELREKPRSKLVLDSVPMATQFIRDEPIVVVEPTKKLGNSDVAPVKGAAAGDAKGGARAVDAGSPPSQNPAVNALTKPGDEPKAKDEGTADAEPKD